MKPTKKKGGAGLTKIVIDQGMANVALSDIAVLQLYLAGSEYVTVVGDRRYIFGNGGYPPVAGDIWRTDPLLIQVIDDLGKDACAGDNCDLCIIEIPQRVAWTVISRMGEPEYISECGVEKPRRWSEPHRMPPVYGEENNEINPYVLKSDVSAEDWNYASAMNFLAACPVPDVMEAWDRAFYRWDYERWFFWQMSQGDDWRKVVKGTCWYEYFSCPA